MPEGVSELTVRVSCSGHMRTPNMLILSRATDSPWDVFHQAYICEVLAGHEHQQSRPELCMRIKVTTIVVTSH